MTNLEKVPDQHDGNKHDNSDDVRTNMTATNMTILTMSTPTWQQRNDQHDGNMKKKQGLDGLRLVMEPGLSKPGLSPGNSWNHEPG